MRCRNHTVLFLFGKKNYLKCCEIPMLMKYLGDGMTTVLWNCTEADGIKQKSEEMNCVKIHLGNFTNNTRYQ